VTVTINNIRPILSDNPDSAIHSYWLPGLVLTCSNAQNAMNKYVQ